jgi:threonine dehydratase
VTALRGYPVLDRELGMSVLIKHENHQPTGSFNARNALSVLARLGPEERAAGVVAATRGNHGQALAWAGALLGIPVTICVPLGNNPEKNAATRGFGAELIEQGRDFELVSEGELSDALRLALRTTHQLVEGAAVAPLAALPKLRDRLAGRTVAIVFSGANIDAATLTEIASGRL